MCVFGTCVYVYIYVYAYFLRNKMKKTRTLSPLPPTHILCLFPHPSVFFVVFLSIVYLLIFPFFFEGK